PCFQTTACLVPLVLRRDALGLDPSHGILWRRYARQGLHKQQQEGGFHFRGTDRAARFVAGMVPPALAIELGIAAVAPADRARTGALPCRQVHATAATVVDEPVRPGRGPPLAPHPSPSINRGKRPLLLVIGDDRLMRVPSNNLAVHLDVAGVDRVADDAEDRCVRPRSAALRRDAIVIQVERDRPGTNALHRLPEDATD